MSDEMEILQCLECCYTAADISQCLECGAAMGELDDAKWLSAHELSDSATTH